MRSQDDVVFVRTQERLQWRRWLAFASAQCRTARWWHGRSTFVNVTLADVDAVSGFAITLYMPPPQLGVQFTVATPFSSVTAKALDSAHVGLSAGAVKSTRTDGAGRPSGWNTVARIVVPFADA